MAGEEKRDDEDGWTEGKEIPLSKCGVQSFQAGTLFPETGGRGVSYLKVLMRSQVGFLSRKQEVLLIFPIPGLAFIFKCLFDFVRSQRGQLHCNTWKCVECECFWYSNPKIQGKHILQILIEANTEQTIIKKKTLLQQKRKNYVLEI